MQLLKCRKAWKKHGMCKSMGSASVENVDTQTTCMFGSSVWSVDYDTQFTWKPLFGQLSPCTCIYVPDVYLTRFFSPGLSAVYSISCHAYIRKCLELWTSSITNPSSFLSASWHFYPECMLLLHAYACVLQTVYEGAEYHRVKRLYIWCRHTH